MRIENERLREFILDAGIIEPEKLEEANNEAIKSGKQLGDFLLEKNIVSDIELRKLYAYILGIPYIDLSKNIISPDILQIVPEPIAKKYNIVAFEKIGNDLKIAMLNPEDLQTIDFIK